MMNPIKDTKSLLSANEQIKCTLYKQVQKWYTLNPIHIFIFYIYILYI